MANELQDPFQPPEQPPAEPAPAETPPAAPPAEEPLEIPTPPIMDPDDFLAQMDTMQQEIGAAEPPEAPAVDVPPPTTAPVVEDEKAALQKQVADLTAKLGQMEDQINRGLAFQKAGALDAPPIPPPPPPPMAPPPPPQVAPPQPGQIAPPGTQQWVAPKVEVDPSSLPTGMQDMAPVLSHLGQQVVDNIPGLVQEAVNSQLTQMNQTTQVVARVNQAFYNAYPGLAPYEQVVTQVAGPYTQVIMGMVAQGQDPSIYFPTIANTALQYLHSQNISVDVSQAPGTPAAPMPAPPNAPRATTPVGAGGRTPAPPIGGVPSQGDYMNFFGQGL
jgi:hypothetical protein